MKKRFLIIGIPIAVAVLAVMGCFFMLFSTQEKIIEQAKDYESYSIYFNYVPPITERGTPMLFSRLYWSEDFDVSVRDGMTHLSIPMRANEFEDFRFKLEVDVNDNGEYWKLINREFVLLDPMDVEININAQNITKKLPIPIGAMAKYRGFYADNTWVPDAGTPDDAEIAALRTATYGGDSFALMRLYALAAAGVDVGANISALQLASVKLTDNEVILNRTRNNPLLKPIVYAKGYRDFPAQEALRQAAEAVRFYNEIPFRDYDNVEWNIDEERKISIANYDDFFNDYGDYPDRIWGAWELDFDGDGLMELVYFYAGGTMGNEFWKIIHLDADGLITSVDHGMDMRSLIMRQIEGRYFFTNWAYDYNDKQSWGLNLFAMKKDGTLWRAEAYYKISGMRTVFSDLYDESVRPLYDDLSGKLFDYYNQYKDYGPESVFDRPFEGDNAVNDLFRSDGYGHYGLGLMDIDNDSEDEIIGEWMYWPSSAHQIFSYDLRALRSGAGHTFNLGTLLTGPDELLHAFLIPYEGKNYFLTMQSFGDSQYIFKLQEISNGTPYVLAAWLVTAEDQVHVNAGEYVDEWGW
ncbi:MAG: hypothetical protein FWG61_05095 [Firmicutes bacterium]|nr:hypothetical protein [Bacillota bacterium]